MKIRIAALLICLCLCFCGLSLFPSSCFFAAADAASGAGSGGTDGNVIPDDALPEGGDESEPPDLSGAASAVLYNLDSHFLMHDYQGDREVYPASTVKLMTAVVAYDHLADRLSDKVTVPAEVIRETAGVSMELRAGEELTVEQLFAGLLVAGANDAAYTLAIESCGSPEVFVARMNGKAKELGMKNTNYVNVTGVDDVTAHTTGRDVLTLAAKAYEIGLVRELSSLPTYEIPATNAHAARTLHTRNYLLSRQIYPYYYDPAASGMNAGATKKGGNCLVAVETIGNVRYLCVVMGAGEQAGEYGGESVTLSSGYLLAEELFDWGSKNFEYRTVVSPMYVYGEIPVALSGGSDYVTAVPTGFVQIFLPKGKETSDYVRVEPVLDVTSLTAPVSEGTEVGTVTVYGADGSVIGSSPLVTKASINLSQWRFIGSKILAALKTRAFAVCVLLFLLFCVIAVLVTARLRYLRARRIALREISKDG